MKYLTVNVLLSRADFIILGMIRSNQKTDTLLKLVTLRLEYFKLTWRLELYGDYKRWRVSIMLKLGRLMQFVTNPSSGRWRRPLRKMQP